jgi:uncharacterized protein (TIGR00369 family)
MQTFEEKIKRLFFIIFNTDWYIYDIKYISVLFLFINLTNIMEQTTTIGKDFLIAQLNQVITRSLSPLTLWLAPIVREVNDDGLVFEFHIREDMTNPVGTLHGGVTAAIMDDMIGATIICLGRDTFYTTVNNVIDYFATAKAGDTVTGKTTIIKAGRQVINVQFELWDISRNRLLARGYSNTLKTEIQLRES